MMNLIQTLSQNQYEEYEALIISKEEYKRKQNQFYTLYIHEFGDLLTESFKQKIECIKLKKMITFCITKSNHNQTINQSELDQYIKDAMSSYNDKLNDLVEENNACKDLVEYDMHHIMLVKKIYRRIAKIIHPDVNAKLYEHQEIKDLWLRTTIAYNALDIDELQEIEVLINKVMKENNYDDLDIEIENIEDKIHQLEEEIQIITTTNPYMYKYLLEDKELVSERKQELQDEIDEYKQYASTLKETLNNYKIEEAKVS